MNGMLADNSLKSYRKAIESFKDFVKKSTNNDIFFPPSLQNVLNYITYLHLNGYAYTTVVGKISAIAYLCKILNVVDITKLFVVQKMLVAVKRKGHCIDSRAPITFDILVKIIQAVDFSDRPIYLKLLIKSMYLIAFNAFLRVGEFTVNTQNDYRKVIQISDIRFFEDSTNERVLELTIREYKHNIKGPPFIVLIPKSTHKNVCVVNILMEYIKIRPNVIGPLFIFTDSKAVSRRFFINELNKDAQCTGMISKNIKSHSFRIGAATTASMCGINDDTIKRLGRWKTDSFKRYVRVPKFMSDIL